MFIILIWTLIGPSLQAPVPSDQAQTTGWVDEPDGRGTFGIITSCVATLTLCVWSAMHLNIAPAKQTYWQRVWYLIKWILLGILIPELVILSAWRQYLSAKRMTKEMKLIFEELDRMSEDAQEVSFNQPRERTCNQSMVSYVVITVCILTFHTVRKGAARDYCQRSTLRMDVSAQPLCRHGWLRLRYVYAPTGRRCIYSKL